MTIFDEAAATVIKNYFKSPHAAMGDVWRSLRAEGMTATGAQNRIKKKFCLKRFPKLTASMI